MATFAFEILFVRNAPEEVRARNETRLFAPGTPIRVPAGISCVQTPFSTGAFATNRPLTNTSSVAARASVTATLTVSGWSGAGLPERFGKDGVRIEVAGRSG